MFIKLDPLRIMSDIVPNESDFVQNESEIAQNESDFVQNESDFLQNELVLFHNSFDCLRRLAQREEKQTREILFCIGTFFCLVLSCSAIASADSDGNFPNKGNYSDWKQAADACEDGVIYAKKGNYTMALQCYDEAIQQYPFDASFYFNKGTALHKKERLAEAIQQFKKAIELEPAFGSAWYNLGNAQKDANQLDEAIKSYQESLRLKPENMKAEFNTAECFFVKKELEQSLAFFQKAQSHSKDPRDNKDCSDYIARIKKMIENKNLPNTH